MMNVLVWLAAIGCILIGLMAAILLVIVTVWLAVQALWLIKLFVIDCPIAFFKGFFGGLSRQAERDKQHHEKIQKYLYSRKASRERF